MAAILLLALFMPDWPSMPIAAVPLQEATLALGPVTDLRSPGGIPLQSAPGTRTQQTVAGEGSTDGPVDYWSMLFVFVLSAFIGLGVIGRVSRLLHTPLMSLTNAISAIAVVGSIVVTGSDYPVPIRICGAVALFASMTNIVSGFLITDRMLKMFRQARSGKGRQAAAGIPPTSGAP